MSNAEERLTLDCPEVFRLLGLSKNHGYSLIARGEFPLPVIRAGRRLLVPRIAVDRLLRERPGKERSHAEVDDPRPVWSVHR